ncbi:hypothetical protein ZWY2020_006024 [Hordeum vulgare]|nr:hypothetical protein ZWY2020_006024 [Hordeum vulgare]
MGETPRSTRFVSERGAKEWAGREQDGRPGLAGSSCAQRRHGLLRPCAAASASFAATTGAGAGARSTAGQSQPRPTVLDGVLSLFRSGVAHSRSLRCNSRRGSPSGPPPSQQQQQQPPPHHRNHPGEIMKRLQRETFPDVMRLMDKHEQIDRILSIRRCSSSTTRSSTTPERSSARAGNRTGLNSRFVLGVKTRGNDTIAAELCTRLRIGATLGEEDTERRPLELTRLQYCAHVNHWLSMILVPFGAQCNGFLHGTSLIQNLRSQASLDGPPSFSEQHNCAAGLSMGIQLHRVARRACLQFRSTGR